jgi:nucleotide-binding universal stress UspA family protein
MITRIAVALDGSALSEKSLPFVAQLARQLKAKVLLLQISLWPEDFNGDIYKTQGSGILPLDYLNNVKQELTSLDNPFGLPADEVEVKVAYRKSVHELGDVALAVGADILVLTTHGRNGLSLLVMGSIATGVLKHAPMPVIVMRPDEETGVDIRPVGAGQVVGPVLVALDGSYGAEASLVPASQLCDQLNAPMHLVEVVTPMSPVIYASLGLGYGYVNYDEQLEIKNMRDEAAAYLEMIKLNLQAVNPQLKIETTVLYGDPSSQITDYSRKVQPLFMAMATHARSEVSQVLLGSVAEQVVRDSHRPVLLTRIPKGYQGYRRGSETGKTQVITGS